MNSPCSKFANSAVCYTSYFVFREDDLSTCKNQQKTKQNNNTRAQGKIIDIISLARMKKFNLFSVAREMLTITHDQNIIYTSKYIYK